MNLQTHVRPIIARGWSQLDETVDGILAVTKVGEVDSESRTDALKLQSMARGKAEILAELMQEFGGAPWEDATADDVSAEAGRRAEARAKGMPYQTRGVELTEIGIQALQTGSSSTPSWVETADKRGWVKVR